MLALPKPDVPAWMWENNHKGRGRPLNNKWSALVYDLYKQASDLGYPNQHWTSIETALRRHHGYTLTAVYVNHMVYKLELRSKLRRVSPGVFCYMK